MTPPERTEGLGELVRALRLYTGLSQREITRKIKMDRRTYQRVENGQEPCPAGFIDTMRELADEFDKHVDAAIAAASGLVAANTTGDAIKIEVRDGDEHVWERAVIGRAAVENDLIMPIMVGINN